METYITASAVFWGRHTLKNHPQCDRDCGHTWNFSITVTGDEDQEFHGSPVDDTKFLAVVEETGQELMGKDIDKMVKPSFSSPVGLCHWLYERYAITYKVIEVTVWHSENLKATLKAS
jgi:6-pyruvoyl-tetrahydropterin synthase